jgi:hypothetical protein
MTNPRVIELGATEAEARNHSEQGNARPHISFHSDFPQNIHWESR